MTTESSFFDILITAGIYLIFVVMLALVLSLVRLQRRRGGVVPVLQRENATRWQFLSSVRALMHLTKSRP